MKKQQSSYKMKKRMANVTKIEKFDLEPKRKKKKKDCDGIYIVSKKVRVKLKHQAKKQIE